MSNSSNTNPQKISFTVNGKLVSLKADASFGDVIDNASGLSTKMDYIWTINGKQYQVNKNQKITNIIFQGSTVIIQNTNQVPNQNPPNFYASNQNQQLNQPIQPPQQPTFNFQQQPIVQQPPIFSQTPIFQQPQKCQSEQPQQLFNNKPIFTPNATLPNQPISVNDTSGDQSIQKQIKNFYVTITDWGKKVIIESIDEDFKAIFLEENAKQGNQGQILFNESDVINSPDEQVKLPLGKFKDKSTKVLFLSHYNGIAIAWTNGLKTKFQFYID